jgi:hypothetical protein
MARRKTQPYTSLSTSLVIVNASTLAVPICLKFGNIVLSPELFAGLAIFWLVVNLLVVFVVHLINSDRSGSASVTVKDDEATLSLNVGNKDE